MPKVSQFDPRAGSHYWLIQWLHRTGEVHRRQVRLLPFSRFYIEALTHILSISEESWFALTRAEH